jgi:hypothetical protein
VSRLRVGSNAQIVDRGIQLVPNAPKAITFAGTFGGDNAGFIQQRFDTVVCFSMCKLIRET